MTKATRTGAALTTLGLAVAAWFITVRQMNGMDMGVATELGSLASFAGYWLPMMAAMTLPGAVALGVMSTTWMSLIAALVLAQKLVPEHRAVGSHWPSWRLVSPLPPSSDKRRRRDE